VTQVNLLPREVRQRQRVRRQTVLVAFAGAAVVAVLVLFWFLQGVRLHDLDGQVKAQEAVNSGLQQQIQGLQKYATMKSNLLQRKQLLTSALANRVEWSSVLHHVSQVEPDRMWLVTMTGTAPSPITTGLTAPTTPTPGTTTPGATLIGNMAFQGNALDSQTMALWLTKLETVKGWVNSWLTGGQVGDINGTSVWAFNSSVDLGPRAAVGGGTP
jgi:Tfp pilus assembly protein PilN